MINFKQYILDSSSIIDSDLHSISELYDWINEANQKTKVSIKLIDLESCTNWIYDKKEKSIKNLDNSFFNIKGITYNQNGRSVQHPIIVQPEIGYLGIACKIIKGVLYFLMQSKIEPGNVNVVQISPTIQATKSNFMRKHGGKSPAYLDLFENVDKKNVIVDQIESEQGTRFLAKRNRNIIIYVDEDIPILSSHKWMTLGQIRELMKIPNLVNMDTRTVLSLLSFFIFNESKNCASVSLTQPFLEPSFCEIVNIFHDLNEHKMKNKKDYSLCSPFELKDWNYVNGAISCKSVFPFDVIFCDIEIEGREVKHWCQPLFRAKGEALFVLLCRKKNSSFECLVAIRDEIGFFDSVELGPSLQMDFGEEKYLSDFQKQIFDLTKTSNQIIYDNVLSEEGGRFFHEENRNVVILCDGNQFVDMPRGYYWCSIKTLSILCQINNILNIQLRNLLSLVEYEYEEN